MTTPDPERAEDDLLLPWHATGRLDRGEADRLDAALAREPDLARRLNLAKTEQRETVALNEALGAPSRRSRDGLFERIDADLAGRRTSGGWLARIGAMLAGLSPPVLAGTALAASLLILLQGGLLTSTWLGTPAPSYETASHRETEPGGTVILVAFASQATAERIADTLREAKGSIVDGPRAGNLYRVRIAADAGALSATLDRLRAQPGVVQLAVPETAPAR
ncbi:MAG: SPOR domain-containing protein [Methylobacterium sp.]|uniref:SPOR domain-containing protein n=1 Tax=Methylobacterium sp. TaxID=409 RepID=UPI0025FF22D3|nr:SPOR domain-containing protein [Methylobacterium sp.]MBX9932810.1 SPOR domain-containing protein [Methylobacterium sp.]